MKQRDARGSLIPDLLWQPCLQDGRLILPWRLPGTAGSAALLRLMASSSEPLRLQGLLQAARQRQPLARNHRKRHKPRCSNSSREIRKGGLLDSTVQHSMLPDFCDHCPNHASKSEAGTVCCPATPSFCSAGSPASSLHELQVSSAAFSKGGAKVSALAWPNAVRPSALQSPMSRTSYSHITWRSEHIESHKGLQSGADIALVSDDARYT